MRDRRLKKDIIENEKRLEGNLEVVRAGLDRCQETQRADQDAFLTLHQRHGSLKKKHFALWVFFAVSLALVFVGAWFEDQKYATKVKSLNAEVKFLEVALAKSDTKVETCKNEALGTWWKTQAKLDKILEQTCNRRCRKNKAKQKK
jgi:hypothetical protein